jgi:triosephosphate isomerase
MRKRIVAGNWKMNLTKLEAEQLLTDLEGNYLNEKDCHIVVCPSFVYLDLANSLQSNMSIGAQNVSEMNNGAFTGEVSARMLQSMGVEYCIVGHSERRQYHSEDDELVNAKIISLLSNGITPILCCGESLDQRELGIQNDVVTDQIRKALVGISADHMKKIVVAYEPIWAIGTGKTASSQQAQDIHKAIRDFIRELYGEVAEEVSILYGGSCKPENASELFACPDIDGGLIGGASLDAKSFLTIANSF